MTDQKPNCPEFILAETTDGLVLAYGDEEFTVDDEMRKDLCVYLMAPAIGAMPEALKELLYIRQWGDKHGWDTVAGLIEARITALKRGEK